MTKPTLDISVKLVTAVPNNVIITDNTDYDALGIDPADVAMTVQIFTPIGLLYSPDYYNTPNITSDLTPTTPFQYADAIDALTGFLLDSKGCFISGEYKVMMKWYNSDTGETFDYVFTENVKLTLPKVVIKQTADCFCAKFRSTDATDYTASTEVDYEHIINYPAETNEPDIETTLKDYTDQVLANGTYVTEITTTRIFASGLVFSVQHILKGSKSFVVDCDSICDIKCGLNTLYNKYQTACGKDKTEADKLLKLLNKATIIYTLLYINNACGNSENSEDYIAQLKTIIGDCGCGCTDCEDAIWVSGACGSSGGSSFDPTVIYEYINSINQTLTNSITTLNEDITNLETQLNELANLSWFEDLVTTCFGDFPSGTETEKKQYIIDLLCTLKTANEEPPVASPDFSSTVGSTPVTCLVTANDFFTTDVVVTITTNGTNGIATVLGDSKTLSYTRTGSFVGVDTVLYRITDANGNYSEALWTITVTAVPSVSCSAVTANYNADFYSVGDNLQIAINNLSNIGANILTVESYQIIIRDSANLILHSYTQAGTLTAAPTIFTSPIPIASNWDNFTIQQSITTTSSTGAACGTATFTQDPYSLTDIGVSWFEGTTPPACLNFSPTDNEIEKRQKLQDAICVAGTSTVNNGISGLGTVASPIQLGGPLIQATTIGGIFDIQNINRRQLYGNLTTPFYNVAFNNNEYFVVAHESATNNSSGSSIFYKKLKLNFALGSIGGGQAVIGSNSNIEMVFADNKTISNTSVVAGDYKVLSLLPATGTTVNAPSNFPSLSNLALATICKDNNTGTINNPAALSLRPIETAANSASIVSPYHIHLAALDGSDLFGKITGTQFAIYQAGVNDVSRFFGPVQNAGGTLQFTSDERGKENIEEYQKGLAEIEQIEVKNFNFKWHKQNKITGVIAQQVEEVLPEAVTKGKFEIPDGETHDDYRFLDQNVLFYTMVNAIKELSSQNKSLTERILALENQS